MAWLPVYLEIPVEMSRQTSSYSLSVRWRIGRFSALRHPPSSTFLVLFCNANVEAGVSYGVLDMAIRALSARGSCNLSIGLGSDEG
jgi:hypothetical protein